MKYILIYSTILSALLTSSQASAALLPMLTCEPQEESSTQEASVRIEFHAPIDPLKPVIGNEYLTVKLTVQDQHRGRNYQHSQIRLYPERSTTDIQLRGGADGQIHVRLNPAIKDGTYAGFYTADIFVNDLDQRAYYNFVGRNSKPGLICR